jgi:hypothetical protein
MGVAIRVDEDEVAGPEGLDTPVLFVEPVMVVPAGEHEVVEVGVAVVGPMDAVVGVAAAGGIGQPRIRQPWSRSASASNWVSDTVRV